MTLLSPKLTPRRDYLEGQGDLGSRLYNNGDSWGYYLVYGGYKYLLNPPVPSSKDHQNPQDPNPKQKKGPSRLACECGGR